MAFNISFKHIEVFKGLALACGVSLCAYILNLTMNAPMMLAALLLGILLNPFFYARSDYQPGICFSASALLKLGIVLLGSRISIAMIWALGWQTLASILVVVLLSVIISLILGRAFGKTTQLSILTATAVSICGASAALAIACILPPSKTRDEDLTFTIIGVTFLSSLAMILYPAITHLLNFNDEMAGVVMGLSLHNVAQSVAAGFLISETSGETATIIKMARISLLVPYLICMNLILNKKRRSSLSSIREPIIPLFLLGFIVVVILNSAGLLTGYPEQMMTKTSHILLTVSVAAIGLQCSFGGIKKMDFQSASLLICQSLVIFVLACFVVGLFY